MPGSGKAMAKKVSWWAAVEIIEADDRTIRRWQHVDLKWQSIFSLTLAQLGFVGRREGHWKGARSGHSGAAHHLDAVPCR
jgi:hypothetical protein